MNKKLAKATSYLADITALWLADNVIRMIGPECDPKLHVSWDCCPTHRAWKSICYALNVRANELNELYQLGGTPTPSFGNGSGFEVGSVVWLKKLSDATGLPLDPVITRQ